MKRYEVVTEFYIKNYYVVTARHADEAIDKVLEHPEMEPVDTRDEGPEVCSVEEIGEES